jgi:hypothetical protein
VLDGFVPATSPVLPALWIDPPRDGSPVPVKGIDFDSVIQTWHNGTVLGAGLHAKETHIAKAEIFDTYEGGIPVASAASGPIAVARDGNGKHPRFGVIGFDPLQENLKFQVTTPILFANFMRWLSPESFSTLDLSAGSVGTATVTLDPNERTDRMRVVNEQGLALPFTLHNGALQLFTAEPSVLHMYSADRERVISLTLPEVAETAWQIPASAARGVPRRIRVRDVPVDLWKWLAAAGLGCWVAEWLLFSRQRRARKTAARRKPAAEREPELAAK